MLLHGIKWEIGKISIQRADCWARPGDASAAHRVPPDQRGPPCHTGSAQIPPHRGSSGGKWKAAQALAGVAGGGTTQIGGRHRRRRRRDSPGRARGRAAQTLAGAEHGGQGTAGPGAAARRRGADDGSARAGGVAGAGARRATRTPAARGSRIR